MTADATLHARLLAELHAERYDSPTEMVLAATLGAVVELCVGHMTEAVDGGLTNADMIPPTEILAAIADQLGLTEGTDRRG